MELDLCAKFQICTVYIQGLKLNKKKKKQNKKNWRIELFAHISGPILTYILTLAIILWCQKWIIIITESKSANWNFQMYRHNGPKPRPSRTTVLCDKLFNILLYLCC